MSTGKKRAIFSYDAPQAEAVYLAGTFNNWSDRADRMKKDPNGTWAKIKFLKPGNYQYKFVVDGKWEIDPAVQNTTTDSSGTINHTLTI